MHFDIIHTSTSHDTMKNFSEVVEEIRRRRVAGAVIDEREHVIIIPVGDMPDLFICITYEYNRLSKDKVKKVQLLCTNERPDLYYDLHYVDAIKTKVIRETTPMKIHGLAVMQILTLAKLKDKHGAKITDIDPTKLFVKTYTITNVVKTNLDAIVSAGGWVGSLDYAGCKRILHKDRVAFDDSTEEVFFGVPASGQVNLVVDFDKGNVDMKAIVISPEPKYHGMHMYTSAGHKKFYSVMYNIPKPMCRGTRSAFLEVQLDDVPFGTFFRDMLLDVFELTGEFTFRLTDVCAF